MGELTCSLLEPSVRPSVEVQLRRAEDVERVEPGSGEGLESLGRTVGAHRGPGW